MLKSLQSKINTELEQFVTGASSQNYFNIMPPLLSRSIKEFILRDGKRIRPVLFIVGYLGFSKRAPKGLYRCSISIELLHDFLLIHDDIIDRSSIRRGKPSMHELFNKYLSKYKNLKFNGQDLAILTGDVIYAMAINAFLSIQVEPEKKEKALCNFIKTMALTGAGEFIELLSGLKKIDNITKEDIYKIYDYKTADYTFSSPLTTGAILAGAGQEQKRLLVKYGTYLGRAFQMQDDIIGIYGNEKEIGKSTLSDLQEAKKTLLIWHAYNNTGRENKKYIKNLLSAEKVLRCDLKKIKKILIESGSLKYTQDESRKMAKKALACIKDLRMNSKYKQFLQEYAKRI